MAEGGEADDYLLLGPAISQHTSPASSTNSLSRSVQDLAGYSPKTSELAIQEPTIQLVDGAITRGQGNEVDSSSSAEINSSESSIEHPETEHFPTRSSTSSIEHPEAEHLPTRSSTSSIEHPEAEHLPTRSSTSSIEDPEAEHLPTRSSASSIERPVEETQHLPTRSSASSIEHPETEHLPTRSSASSIEHPETEHLPTRSSASSIEHPEAEHLPTRSSASSIEDPVEETQHLSTRSSASSIEHPETQHLPTRSSASNIEDPVEETQHLPTRSSASSIENPVEETEPFLAPSSSFCCSHEHQHETDSTVQTWRDASSNEQPIGEVSPLIVDAAAPQGAEPSATEDSGQLRQLRFIILMREVADRHSSAPTACCRREELNPSVGEYSFSREEKQERIRSQGSKPRTSRNTHETSSNSTEAVTVQELQQPPKPQASNIAARLAASFNQQANVTVARAATREQLLELPPAKKQQQNVYADREKRKGMEQAHRTRTPPTMQNGATSSGMATAIEAAAAAAIDPSATQSPDCPNTSTLDLVSTAMTDESRDQLLRVPPVCSNGNSETDLPLAQEDSSAATVSAIDEPNNESQSRPLLQDFGSRASVSEAEAVSWTLRGRSHPNSTVGQSGGQLNISSDNEQQQSQQQQHRRRSRRLAVRTWLRLLNFCTSCSCLKR